MRAMRQGKIQSSPNMQWLTEGQKAVSLALVGFRKGADVQGALFEVVRRIREGEHGDDLEDRARDREHVGVEGRETDALDRQGHVCQPASGCRSAKERLGVQQDEREVGRTALDGRGRDVGDEADEDEAPQMRVLPRLDAVLERDLVLKPAESLSRVVAEDAAQSKESQMSAGKTPSRLRLSTTTTRRRTG